MARSARLPLEQLQPYLLDVPHPRLPPREAPETPEPPLRWPEIFGDDKPVEIEVGFGKGMFLANVCRERVDANFLGVEIERKYVLLAAARLAKFAPRNIRLACTDAKWFFSRRVADGSVQAVHIFFPDPWWKNRHRKRKLMGPDFASQIVRVLRSGGILHFKTDVAGYFDETMEILAAETSLRRQDEAVGDDALTNFERKYREEGRPIHRAVFEKR